MESTLMIVVPLLMITVSMFVDTVGVMYLRTLTFALTVGASDTCDDVVYVCSCIYSWLNIGIYIHIF